jgi:hypothetical protein
MCAEFEDEEKNISTGITGITGIRARLSTAILDFDFPDPVIPVPPVEIFPFPLRSPKKKNPPQLAPRRVV